MTGGTAGDRGGGAGRPPEGVDGPPPRPVLGGRVVLFGIGNDLRGDDGAGPAVARALEGRVPWDLRVAHGLTPELADDLAACELALFVDASADPGLARPTWTTHGAAPQAPASPLLGHALDVPALLALTARLHGRVPAAATLALPARDFGLGERLTPTAADAVRAAVEALAALAADCVRQRAG
jgi:hydrogenase maturation protease